MHVQAFFDSDGAGVTLYLTITDKTTGNHVDPDSWPITNDPAIVLSSHPSAAKTVTKIDVGVYKVVWSGLSPAIEHGTVVHISVDGAISSTAWSTWVVPLQVVHLPPKQTHYTEQRANYIDKLNVTGTLAHSDDAATYRADLTSTQSAILDAIAAVDLIVDAIKLKTDNLPSDPATETTLAVIDSLIDAIKAKTDQLAFTVANQVDANALSGGGGGGLDAAGVRAAIGLASANLDAQLADIPTVSEFNARTLPSADYFTVGAYTAPDNASIAAIVSKTINLPSDPADASDIAAAFVAIQSHGDLNWVTADVSGLSTLTAQQVWEYNPRSLTTFGSLVSDIVTAVWSAATRTLTTVGDSSGITTLLSRITGLIRTKTEDETAETNQTTAIRNGLALETTSQIILADTNELQSRFATMVEDDGASGWQFTVLALENVEVSGGDATLENQETIIQTLGTISSANKTLEAR